MTDQEVAELRADDPYTICDRLNGVYNSVLPTSGVYNTPPIEKEASREIERLRQIITQMGGNAL